jgi:uncharacterized membrane protein YkvA (DUF1232 family)
VAATVAAYALSPIDLIPDVVPVLGYLDDLILVPLGLWIAIRLISPGIMSELRERAEQQSRPLSRAGLVIVVTIWVAATFSIGWWMWS